MSRLRSMAQGLFRDAEAIAAVVSRLRLQLPAASAISWSPGTTLETRPHSCAVFASMTSPVKRSSQARLMPITRGSSQAPPSPRIRPTLRKVTPYRAVSEEMRMSAMQATSQPRPIAHGAVDGGNQRDFEIVEGAHDHVDAVLVIVTDLGGVACEGADAVAHRLDVAAGGKPAARSR